MKHRRMRRFGYFVAAVFGLSISAISLAQPVVGQSSGALLAGGGATEYANVENFVLSAGGPQLALYAEVSEGKLWVKACSSACSAREGTPVELPPEVDFSQGRFEALKLRGDRSVLHWVAPLLEASGRAVDTFQVLVASSLDGDASEKILYARSTFTASQSLLDHDGLPARAAVLQIKPGKNGHRIVAGEVRSDVNLCGRPALLAPQLLVAKDLSFHASKLQRLGRDERQAAVILQMLPIEEPRIDSSSASSPVSQAPRLLHAVASSSAIGGPELLTDGDWESHWSEARGGTGRGEFVVLRAVRDAGLTALDILVRGSSGDEAQGVAPRVMWLATGEQLYRLDWLQDAWQTPGQWYRATFPSPIYSSCLSLVLELGQQEQPNAHLTLTEVRGLSPFAELNVDQLLERLGEPGEAGEAAVAFLQLAGPEALQKLATSFSSLSGLSRDRAWGVLGAAQCEVTRTLFASLLTSDSEAERKRAIVALNRCGPSVVDALLSEFRSLPAASQLVLVQQLPLLAPALAVNLSLELLAKAPASQAALLRDVVSKASRRREALGAVRLALVDEEHSLKQKVQLLRSLGDAAAELKPEFEQAVLWAISRAQLFEERYWLLEPLGRLVAQKKGLPAPRAYKFLLANMRDVDPQLRARAVQFAPNTSLFGERLRHLMVDPQVRVREAAVRRAAVFVDVSTQRELLLRLAEDKWPFVRTAAIHSLVEQGQSASVDRRLAQTVAEDDSALVRVAAIVALGKRNATHYTEALVERFADKREEPLVRAAAAMGLAALCEQSVVPDFTRAVHRLLRLPVPESSQILGRAALHALGVLAPADIEQRLAPLLGPKVPAVLRFAAQAALSSSGTCPKLLSRSDG